jgi:hypothetical protein
MTAAIRPSQSNTGAPEAPSSTAKRLSPSYISRSAVGGQKKKVQERCWRTKKERPQRVSQPRARKRD